MATFKAGAPSVGSASIGGQQIVGADRPSVSGAVNSIAGDIANVRRAAAPAIRAAGEQAVTDAIATVAGAQEEIAAAPAQLRDQVEGPIRPVDEAAARQGTFGGVNAEVLGVDQFSKLKQGMRTGVISQDKVDLIVASEIKKRTAANPIFANDIRNAAASVVGFDPTSKIARAQLDALGTDPKKPNRQTTIEKWNDEYDAIALSGVNVTREQYLNAKGQEEVGSLMDKSSKRAYDAGIISNSEWLSDKTKTDTANTINNLALPLMSRPDGNPISGLAAKQMIDTARIAYIAEATANYKGDLNGAEFVKFKDETNKRYASLNSYIQNGSLETLTATKLQNVKDQQELLGYALFGNEMVIKKAYGDRAFDTLIKLASSSKNQQEFANKLAAFPSALKAYNFLGSNPAAMVNELQTTATNMASGIPLTDLQKQVAPAVAALLSESPDVDVNPTVKGLADNNLETTAISILVEKSPRRADADNRAFYKQGLERDVPVYTARLADVLSLSTANIRYSEREGQFVTTEPLGYHNDATDPLESLNMYVRSMDRGWGEIGGTNKATLIKQIESDFAEQKDVSRRRAFVSDLNEVLALSDEGDIGQAKLLYRRTAERVGDRLKGVTFDQFMARGNRDNRRLLDVPNFAVPETTTAPAGSGVLTIEAQNAVNAGFGADRAAAMEAAINKALAGG